MKISTLSRGFLGIGWGLTLALTTPARAGDGEAAASHRLYSRGDVFRLTSPDTAQTYSDGNTIRFVLLWDGRRGELLAAVTFSNTPYIDWQRPRREESFNFRLPGVTLDPGTGVFTARDARGRRVPVAAYQRGGLANGDIRPTVGTLIRIAKPEGRVRVSLTATPGSPPVASREGGWSVDGVVSLL